jgi:hypothetical protein
MHKRNGAGRTVKALKMSKETLRRLAESDLERAGGGYPSEPSICPSPGSENCCLTR